jgi:ribosomal protein S8
MQQVQKVNDYCTRLENCPKSRRQVGQHVKCNNNTFCTCCMQHFSYDRTKKQEKNNDKQQFSPVRRVSLFARS